MYTPVVRGKVSVSFNFFACGCEPSFGNGHVVDFIQIPLNFPIFNLADTFIVSMAILTVIRVMRGENLGGIEPKTK
jgi:signal peptidase II